MRGHSPRSLALVVVVGASSLALPAPVAAQGDWTSTVTAGAPAARASHVAVWTGSRMIVWGGTGTGFANAGGIYDPATERRMDRMGQDVVASRELSRLAATQAPAAAGAPAPAGALPAPESLYGQAYANFSKGNWALAASGFEEYAERFPDSDQSDNALYWIAECAFAQGKYGDALRAYDRLLERYPRSEKAAAANLKKALALLQQNEVAKASVQLKFVVDTYPGTDEAKIAADRLAALGR